MKVYTKKAVKYPSQSSTSAVLDYFHKSIVHILPQVLRINLC